MNMGFHLLCLFTLALLPLQMWAIGGLPSRRTHVSPITVNTTWHVAHLSEINCRFASKQQVPEWKITKEILTTELVTGAAGLVKGYLCHKAKLVTRCSTTWYMSSSIEHLIHDISPNEEECRRQLLMQGLGQTMDDITEFPLPDCGWNAENIAETVVVSLTQHPMYYEEMADSLRDSLIPGGSCTGTTACPTIYKSTIWISESKEMQRVCKNKVGRSLVFKADEQKNIMPRVYVPGSGVFGQSDMCLAHLCGTFGLVTSAGDAFFLNSSVLEALQSKGVRTCDMNTKLRAHSRAELKASEVNIVRADVEILQCESAKNKIKNGEPLRPNDFYALSPKTTGLHPVYRIENGTLMSGIAVYVHMDAPPKRPTALKGGCYLGNDAGELIKSDYWIPVGNETYMTYGGITCRNGIWSEPADEMIDEDIFGLTVGSWKEDYHPMTSVIIDENGTIYMGASANHGANVIVTTTNAIGSGMRAIGSGLSSAFGWFWFAICMGVFVAIMIGLCLIIACICKLCRRKVPNKVYIADRQGFEPINRKNQTKLEPRRDFGMHPI